MTDGDCAMLRQEMDREALFTAFRLQVGGCRLFGSPFYAELLEHALADVRQGGPVARLVERWEGDPLRAFLPLRILGAVHERVLAGDAPELARYYPTAGGRADASAAWPLFRALVDEHCEALRPRLENFPQTNEVRRCAGLLGGFLCIAQNTALPLRLREIGCSAGLNLQWARYRYRLGPYRWGDGDSPVEIRTDWRGTAAPFGAPVRVESRAGCDLDPPHIESDTDVRLLEAFVWADQPDRLEQLRAAVRLARADPPRVDRARARDWLPGELAAPAQGVCRVVFHSSMWIYLAGDEQAELRERMAEHGARATPESPLAWLSHENGADVASIEVRLTLWPGGDEQHLGMGHPHGRFVDWF